MNVIDKFFDKRLVEYLYDRAKVLVLFDWHGMGDCIMFLPLYNRMKELYPNVSFNLKCGRGQEIFNDIHDTEYDLCFNIRFPEFNNMCCGVNFNGLSKPEICCIYELGIPFDETIEFTWKPKEIIDSKIPVQDKTIGVAFQVTSNPSKSIEYECAKKIWNTIKDYGFTPLEVHFEHVLRNQINKKYDFIDNTCRIYEPSISNVIDVINKCKGFVGVNTGTFCMATAMKNGNVIHLYKRYHFAPNYKRFNPVTEVDCRHFCHIDESIIKEYLSKLQ